MNEGVKIILARLRSNPEEFLEHNSIWADIVHGVRYYEVNGKTDSLWFLTEEELDRLASELKTTYRAQFTDTVLSKLFNVEEEQRSKA